MRKFLLRWLYTPNWRADTYHRMMLDWNGNWLVVDIGPDPYRDLWQHSDGTEHVPEEEIQAAVAYAMSPDLMDEAFSAEYEVVKRRFEAEIRRIVGIDVENRTVTLDSTPEPERECVDPGWQASVYNLELPE